MDELPWTPLPAFEPHRMVRGGHAQTLLGSYFFGGRARDFAAELHLVELDDGDRIAMLDTRPEGWRAADGAAVLVHGLCGCHGSGYMIRTAEKLLARGARVFRVDMRGCGASERLSRLPVHAGRSDDVAAAVRAVERHCPGAPLVSIGFSLGGNLVLKMAGEMGANAPSALRGVIAVAPPIDLVRCSNGLRAGASRVYDQSFLRRLLRMWREREKLPRAARVDLPRRPRTLYEFDDLITARLGGFESADDYYRRASAAPLLPRIAAPTLILAADDDPLISAEVFSCPASPRVRLELTRSGGHIGYVGRSGVDPDRRWLDWRVAEQATAALAAPALSSREPVAQAGAARGT